jgi:hypothetical protein
MKSRLCKVFMIVSFGFAMTNCVHYSKTNKSLSDISRYNSDLTVFIRNVYEWIETKGSKIDFDVITGNGQDRNYIGIDWVKHTKRLEELKSTNFFSSEFIDTYEKIAHSIDKRLKDGSIVYPVGELAPYGNGTNPWCNCQDSPDEYWKNIMIMDIKIANDKVSFAWTWGNNFMYKVMVSKVGESYKINYLQGFDYAGFIRR